MVIVSAKSMPNGKKPYFTGQIKLYTTGGTIEKSYDEEAGVLENRESFLAQVLTTKIRLPHTTIDLECLMNKDSLHMTIEDRLTICEAIIAAHEQKQPCIILHGTDTLVETTRVCKEELQKRGIQLQVPVVFTGAMRPVGYDTSDGPQNITEALIAVKILPPDIYISFHSQIFVAPDAVKNRTTKTFDWT